MNSNSDSYSKENIKDIDEENKHNNFIKNKKTNEIKREKIDLFQILSKKQIILGIIIIIFIIAFKFTFLRWIYN